MFFMQIKIEFERQQAWTSHALILTMKENIFLRFIRLIIKTVICGCKKRKMLYNNCLMASYCKNDIALSPNISKLQRKLET